MACLSALASAAGLTGRAPQPAEAAVCGVVLCVDAQQIAAELLTKRQPGTASDDTYSRFRRSIGGRNLRRLDLRRAADEREQGNQGENSAHA